MAAITPWLEEPNQDEESADYFDCTSPVAPAAGRGLAGLGAKGRACPTPQQIMDSTHANLVRMIGARKIAWELVGRLGFELEQDGVDYYIRLGGPIDQSALQPFGELPASRVPHYRVRLLSWTSKMDAPSFSLPAGASELGGACPGAKAGQSVVATQTREKAKRVALTVLRDHASEGIEDVDLTKAVCQHCYATGGNYLYSSGVLDGILRFYWTEAALAQGTFVPTMINALANADYTTGGNKTRRLEPAHWAETGWRFFRIHDSGDFYSPAYFRAWKAICDAFAPGNPYGLPPTLFWAPTRMWAMGAKWINLVNEVNGDPNNRGNFIIRPSAYEIDQPAPDLYREGGGWAAASTVGSKETVESIQACEVEPFYDWNCQAYAVDAEGQAKDPKDKTCRGSLNPYGNIGCRVCWAAPSAIVNYTAH